MNIEQPFPLTIVKLSINMSADIMLVYTTDLNLIVLAMKYAEHFNPNKHFQKPKYREWKSDSPFYKLQNFWGVWCSKRNDSKQ